MYACIKNYMCHTYHNPPKPVTIPLSSKKKTKNKKTRTTHAHFFRLPHGLEDRNVTNIYSFEPILLTRIDDVIGQVVIVMMMTS